MSNDNNLKYIAHNNIWNRNLKPCVSLVLQMYHRQTKIYTSPTNYAASRRIKMWLVKIYEL